MSAATASIRDELKPAMYVGIAVTTIIALLPFLNDFFVTSFVVGALAAVWFAVRKNRQHLSQQEGGQLGFLSGFYGLLAANGLYDFIWQFLHYELWQVKNADRLLSILGGMLHDVFSPSAWIVMIYQIVFGAILAGIFGAPAGLLWLKLLQRRTA